MTDLNFILVFFASRLASTSNVQHSLYFLVVHYAHNLLFDFLFHFIYKKEYVTLFRLYYNNIFN